MGPGSAPLPHGCGHQLPPARPALLLVPLRRAPQITECCFARPDVVGRLFAACTRSGDGWLYRRASVRGVLRGRGAHPAAESAARGCTAAPRCRLCRSTSVVRGAAAASARCMHPPLPPPPARSVGATMGAASHARRRPGRGGAHQDRGGRLGECGGARPWVLRPCTARAARRLAGRAHARASRVGAAPRRVRSGGPRDRAPGAGQRTPTRRRGGRTAPRARARSQRGQVVATATSILPLARRYRPTAQTTPCASRWPADTQISPRSRPSEPPRPPAGNQKGSSPGTRAAPRAARGAARRPRARG